MGYKLNKIYVGQNQVRPSSPTPTPIHLSTDLTQCRSLSDVTAQGWTGIAKYNSGNYTLANGNGIQITSGHNFVVSLYYQLQTPLTTSNRVVLHWTGYGFSGSYSGATRAGINTSSGNTGGKMLYGRLAFNTNGADTEITIDGSNISGKYSDGYGNYDLTLDADLSTGAVSLTGTAQSGAYTNINLTGILTSSQIQSVINKGYICFEETCYSFYGHQLHSAEVTIY